MRDQVMATTTFVHPTIGRLRGVPGKGLSQFLGVQYASLKDRLAVPEEILDYGGGEIYVNKLGPQALSSPTGCDFEHSLIQQSLPHSEFEISDRNCLHLNVTVPNGAKNLPVMVFIHGGGFAGGSVSWPQYDQARLVEVSITMGKPIIGVSVNYRLGVPGFLTSEELRKAGYKTNNGIRDQKVALQWVKRNIEGFGGNPNLVTIAGQSAGAVTSMLLLQSPELLFQQLISMGGTPMLLPHLPRVVSEGVYSTIAAAQNVDKLSAEERVNYILNCPMEELCSKLPPGLPLIPVVDDDLVKALPTYKQTLKYGPTEMLPGMTWCKRLLIGDCQFDGSIYKGALDTHLPNLGKRFHEFLKESLAGYPLDVSTLEEAYGINPDSPDDVVTRNILQWATDIGFSLPAKVTCQTWLGESYLYHFNEKNPWDGFGKGEATHIFDVALLFMNFEDHLSPAQRARASFFIEDVLQFVNADAPFPSYQSEHNGARVYGPVSARFVTSNNAEDFGRRSTIQQLEKHVGFDAMNRVLGDFLSKKW